MKAKQRQQRCRLRLRQKCVGQSLRNAAQLYATKKVESRTLGGLLGHGMQGGRSGTSSTAILNDAALEAARQRKCCLRPQIRRGLRNCGAEARLQSCAQPEPERCQHVKRMTAAVDLRSTPTYTRRSVSACGSPPGSAASTLLSPDEMRGAGAGLGAIAAADDDVMGEEACDVLKHVAAGGQRCQLGQAPCHDTRSVAHSLA